MQIDRRNRDRKGGHRSTGLEVSDGADERGVYTPVQRSFLKRQGKRMLRRQHKRAINEGLVLFAQEEESRQAAYWAVQQDLDWEAKNQLDNYPEALDDDEYDPFGYGDFDYSCPGCAICDPDRGWASRASDPVDARVANELLDQIIDGRTVLDLEVIEQRDAGKSLGQLLRERLQTPF